MELLEGTKEQGEQGTRGFWEQGNKGNKGIFGNKGTRGTRGTKETRKQGTKGKRLVTEGLAISDEGTSDRATCFCELTIANCFLRIESTPSAQLCGLRAFAVKKVCDIGNTNRQSDLIKYTYPST